MRRVGWSTLLLLTLTSASETAMAEGKVYVQSLTAAITAEPRFGAEKIAEVHRGDALPLVEARDRWCMVRVGDRLGWVPQLVVTDHPPMAATSTLTTGAAQGASIDARRRASAATTAGAARGLTYEDRMRAGDGANTDYAAVERVEQFSVSEEEALAFIAAGVKQ